jgi:hypothetical protein
MKVGFRNQQAQLSSLLGCVLIASTIAICSLAVDVMHTVSAQQELQAAVDAGALAGAAHICETSLARAQAEAIEITSQNFVEAVRVSSASPQTTVTTELVASTENRPGSVTVTANREINFVFARIFGCNTAIISATACAGGLGSITQLPAGTAFPLAISINAIPKGNSGAPEISLSQLRPGEQFEICLGSQKEKNAAFTSFDQGSANNNYFKTLIDECLKIEKTDKNIPSVKVGMEINLNNGEGGFNYLTNDPEYAALLNQPFVVFPLFEGSPPFNQSQPVIGFVAMKITSISKDKGRAKITGKIVKPALRGQASQSYTGSFQQEIRNLSPQTVRLIR